MSTAATTLPGRWRRPTAHNSTAIAATPDFCAVLLFERRPSGFRAGAKAV